MFKSKLNIMYKVVLIFIDFIIAPIGKFRSGKIGNIITRISQVVYAAYIRHQLCEAPRLHIIGIPIYITGGCFTRIGRDTTIGFGTKIEAFSNFHKQVFHPEITIGERVLIGALSHIGCINSVHIGDDTTLGERTYITDHAHGETNLIHSQLPPLQRPLVSRGPVIIGKKVSIGENCVILSGVTIGDNSFIGANSVVTRDIPANCVAVGAPARVIKHLH